MAIGFAAISTTLIINGNAKVGKNVDDLDIIFMNAIMDYNDIYDTNVSEDKKTIIFTSKDLKGLGDVSVLDYEVTNNSSNYNAEIVVNCGLKDDGSAKYTSIKNELENNAKKVLAKETLNGTLTVNLEKVATEELTEEYICKLEFNAVERDPFGKSLTQFEKDSRKKIVENVQSCNTNDYHVGDIKNLRFAEHTDANGSFVNVETDGSWSSEGSYPPLGIFPAFRIA